MRMQRLCHQYARPTFLSAALICTLATVAVGDTPVHDYPTHARVEYVNECIGKNEGKLASLYQCSCAIDRIAAKLSYDAFTEASTFAKYSSLPGEGGGIFRDSDQARQLAKMYRELEADAYRACGLEHE